MTDNLPNPTPQEVKPNSEKAESESAEILDRLDNLPEDQQEEILATLEMYAGPIPHPVILAGYQKLYDEAAKKIIDNGVEESGHRRHLETSRQRRRGHLAYIALVGGLILTAGFIAASFWLIYLGHAIIGSVFAGTAFLAMMGTLFELAVKLTENDDLHAHENENNSESND